MSFFLKKKKVWAYFFFGKKICIFFEKVETYKRLTKKRQKTPKIIILFLLSYMLIKIKFQKNILRLCPKTTYKRLTKKRQKTPFYFVTNCRNILFRFVIKKYFMVWKCLLFLHLFHKLWHLLRSEVPIKTFLTIYRLQVIFV